MPAGNGVLREDRHSRAAGNGVLSDDRHSRAAGNGVLREDRHSRAAGVVCCVVYLENFSLKSFCFQFSSSYLFVLKLFVK